MKTEYCTFCRIVAEDPWNQVIYADSQTVAFLDIAPAARGHTLVIPRRHCADIFEISEEDLSSVTRTVRHVAHQLEDGLRPDGLSLVQSNRAAAWQDVFHLHFHLIPRYNDDELVPPWGQVPQQLDEVRKLAAELRTPRR